MQKLVARLDEENVVTSGGRRCSELFVMRGLALCEDALGRQMTSTIVRDPVSSHKKDGWTCFAMMANFLPLSRDLGHRGIVTTCAVLDGGLFAHQQRRMRQRHSLWHYRLADRALAEDLELMDWPLAVWCKCHNAHTAVDWGVRWLYVDKKAEMRDLHIAIESLLNSWDDILSHAADLIQVVDFTAVVNHKDCVAQWWQSLSYKPALVESLAELDLRWDGVTKRLLVNDTVRNRPDIHAHIFACIIGAFHISKFIEGRWLALGTCSRPLIGAVSIGLDYVVDAVMADPDAGQEFLGGYKRYTPHIRTL